MIKLHWCPFCFFCSCKVDETLIYHPSNHLSERFSVESFSFIGDHPFVFVHCHVRICNASDPNSKCVRICEDVERRKRDVSYAAELGNDVYPLAQGPLSLLKEEVDGKGRSSSIESAGKSSLFYLQKHCSAPESSQNNWLDWQNFFVELNENKERH